MILARLFNLLLIAAAAVFLCPFSASGQTCVDYTEYPHWVAQFETPVWSKDVVVEGGYAYLAIRTGGIMIFDISDPNHPLEVSHLVGATQPGWSAQADYLDLHRGYLYVCDEYFHKVHVIDVQDPANPVVITEISTPSHNAELDLYGDYLYLAAGSTGVEVYNIADPAHPVHVRTVSGTWLTNVKVINDLLITTSLPGRTSIYSLADPGHPILQDQFDAPDELETWGLASLGDLVYVSGFLNIWILDISIPQATELVGTFPRGSQFLEIADGRLYLTPFHLEVYDLVDPLDPTLVHVLPDPAYSFSPLRQVTMSGGFLFAAADDAGLMVADFGGKDWEGIQSHLAFQDEPEDMMVLNDLALVATGTHGLQCIDVADPEIPSFRSALDTYDARALKTSGGLVYLGDGGDGLKILDYADPENPQLLGHYDTYSRVVSGLSVDGSVVYLAAGLNGLMVVDAGDLENPVLLGQNSEIYRALDVAHRDQWAFVLDSSFGLQVVDVSQPEVPTIVASLELGGSVSKLVLAGPTLYAGDPVRGIYAVDISDPLVPELITWLPIEANDLVWKDGFLRAASGEGVALLDVRDPSQMTSIGFLPALQTRDGCYALGLKGAYCLMAGTNLVVGPNHCPEFSAVGEMTPDRTFLTSFQGVPNPFNPRITLSFELARAQTLDLAVFDLAGKRVATLAQEFFEAGEHSVTWDGRNDQGQGVAAGCYFVVARGGRHMTSTKITLVR